MSKIFTLIVLATTLLGPSFVFAQTPTCDALGKDNKARAHQIFSNQHPWDCCDETLADCLKQMPRCALVNRLANNICRRILKGQSSEKIKHALSRRAQSMVPALKPAKIHLDKAYAIGASDAPVVVVEYACARCPYCAVLTPALYEAIVNGPLKDKVRLYFKPFPIRSHPGSKEGGMAFVAAAKLGQFWPYLLYAYENYDEFCPDNMGAWASATGMDKEKFLSLLKDAAIKKELVESKKEGIRNKVDATPTLFINGRKYLGELNIEEVVDVLKEEIESLNL